MACSGKSDRDVILEVLEKISHENCAVAKRHNHPSSAGDFLGSSFQKGKKAKVKALKNSFHPKTIHLIEKTRGKASKQPSDEQEKGEQTTQLPLSPQHGGIKHHIRLAEKINEDRRDGNEGKMLEMIEKKFRCQFIQAEVRISGCAVKTQDSFEKLTLDFWSGEMDAVAIRRENDVLEVFVADWKSSAKADEQLILKWWENAGNFKRPLYQCLVYRELLQAHFNRYGVDAVVGIILVPFHQSHPEIIRPGLCVDFQEMEKLLLHRLKEYEWKAVLDESFDVHTIKMPCKLINDSFDPTDYVDESTNILKDDTSLKDVFNDNATVDDLCLSLGLSFLKVERVKKEEKTNIRD
ncbi:uncharacterized protein LOC114951143 [Acropora millepora]|uniref:uncharacterized protein LOC114951143 n=1 Tax=Acropora millepora TaxID=45264 RepID=UPI001CF1EC70|nr:uncharacterized protein LOC114951143 [Acropora millepora]